jgi:hypothetical protein
VIKLGASSSATITTATIPARMSMVCFSFPALFSKKNPSFAFFVHLCKKGYGAAFHGRRTPYAQ